LRKEEREGEKREGSWKEGGRKERGKPSEGGRGRKGVREAKEGRSRKGGRKKVEKGREKEKEGGQVKEEKGWRKGQVEGRGGREEWCYSYQGLTFIPCASISTLTVSHLRRSTNFSKCSKKVRWFSYDPQTPRGTR
jgi:hypothetical protein